jgi:hypothetical protein
MRKVARGLAVLRRLATCGSSPFARVHAGRGLDFRLLMQVFKNKAPSACAGRAFFGGWWGQRLPNFGENTSIKKPH